MKNACSFIALVVTAQYYVEKNILQAAASGWQKTASPTHPGARARACLWQREGRVSDESDFHDYVGAKIASWSRVAYLLTGDWHAAEDLVQVTLIRLATHWTRVSASGDPDAYVRRVLYTQHVSLWRKGRQLTASLSRSAELTPPGSAARDGADEVTTAVVIHDALAKLTRKQRAVLVLRFFEDRTEAQTAQVLRCSVSTVKSQTRDALARIRVVAPELHELVGKKVPR